MRKANMSNINKINELDNNNADIVSEHSTVNMHSDVVPRDVSPPSMPSFDYRLLRSVQDGAIHDLKSFLARPSAVLTGTWLSTAIAGAGIGAVNIPQDIVANVPAFSSKIYGFLGFRAKTVLRLQVNTNRFQQGLLTMVFFPQNLTSITKIQTCFTSLMFQTQLPRITFDASSDSEVVMEIPYIAPQLAWDTTTNDGPCGQVSILVYDPLTSASSELSAEFILWAHFEDVEIMFPTASNTAYVPQAGGKKIMRSGIRAGAEPCEVEVKTEGWLSNSFGKLKAAADCVAEIPLLTPYAGTVSWLSGIAQKTALALGFSNPNNHNQMMLVQQRPFTKAMNASGLDNSHNMGIAEDNHVGLLNGFAGQDCDEMAFSYPLSIPTWFRTIPWVDSATPYNVLSIIPLSPMSFATTAGSITNTTPLSYIGNCFQLWRGGFKFRFRFVKTEFHSGRLAIVFVPTGTVAYTPTVTQNNISLFHREIIDLRTSTIIDITIPYASTKPYLPTSHASFATLNVIGHLHLVVINELRHPDTVTSTINIVAEVCAAPDFEFAVPIVPDWIPLVSATAAAPQSGGTKRFKPQAAEVSDQNPTNSSAAVDSGVHLIGGTKDVDMDHMPSVYCVGEKVLSIRQLIKRSSNYNVSPNITAASINGQIYPFAFNCAKFNTTGSVFINATQPTDYLSYFGLCYAFFRGSVRLRSYCSSGNNNTNLSLYNKDQSNTPCVNWQYTTAGPVGNNSVNFVPVAPAPNSVYPCPEITVPYYNSLPSSNVVYDSTVTNTNVYTTTRPKLMVRVYSTSQTGILFTQRQAADDFHLGFWTGSLPLTDLTHAVGTQTW